MESELQTHNGTGTSGMHSPTHSGISTLNQDGVKSLWGLSSTNSDIRIWHSLYTLPEVCIFLVCTSPTLSGISTLSQKWFSLL